MDAREDGVYITYTPTAGADAVTKKLGSSKFTFIAGSVAQTGSRNPIPASYFNDEVVSNNNGILTFKKEGKIRVYCFEIVNVDNSAETNYIYLYKNGKVISSNGSLLNSSINIETDIIIGDTLYLRAEQNTRGRILYSLYYIFFIS